ncbi:MAG: hypothetical protein AB1755_01770 [Candidatus Omnitrophota bacterium]
MGRAKLFLGILICFIFFPIHTFAAKETVWQQLNLGPDFNFYSVCVHPKNKDIIFVGTDRSVLKVIKEKEAQEVLNVTGDTKTVNYLSYFQYKKRNILFAATGNGLFISKNDGRNWNKVFDGKSRGEKNCNYVCVSLNRIFLATDYGLFYSDDLKTWNKVSGDLLNTEVLNIIADYSNPKVLYAVSSRGVFKSLDLGQYWQRIFTWIAQDTEESDENSDDDKLSEETSISQINFIAQDRKKHNIFYLATIFGIFKSEDDAGTWQKFNEQGLFDRKLIQVFVSKENNLYVLSKRSIFEYKDEIWHNLYRGLDSENLRFLFQDIEDNFLLATQQGLYRSKEELIRDNKIVKDEKNILEHFKDEPTIQDVQKVAIKYAEVSPQKIINWRRQAAARAFLPELDLAYDKNVYGSSTGAFAVGPKDWGVNFKWDLADLIYNPDQTSIDVRSRLMVQLRDDILNEVTRIYFERRRLQAELFMSPPQDTRKIIEKELRLEELTASIDALTGGYFSKAIEKSKKYSKNKRGER